MAGKRLVTTVTKKTKLYRFEARDPEYGGSDADAPDVGVMVRGEDPEVVVLFNGGDDGHDDGRDDELTPDQADELADHLKAAARVARWNASPKIAKARASADAGE